MWCHLAKIHKNVAVFLTLVFVNVIETRVIVDGEYVRLALTP